MTSTSETSSLRLDQLPIEILVRIAGFLMLPEYVSFVSVCRALHNITLDPTLWKRLYRRWFGAEDLAWLSRSKRISRAVLLQRLKLEVKLCWPAVDSYALLLTQDRPGRELVAFEWQFRGRGLQISLSLDRPLLLWVWLQEPCLGLFVRFEVEPEGVATARLDGELDEDDQPLPQERNPTREGFITGGAAESLMGKDGAPLATWIHLYIDLESSDGGMPVDHAFHSVQALPSTDPFHRLANSPTTDADGTAPRRFLACRRFCLRRLAQDARAATAAAVASADGDPVPPSPLRLRLFHSPAPARWPRPSYLRLLLDDSSATIDG